MVGRGQVARNRGTIREGDVTPRVPVRSILGSLPTAFWYHRQWRHRSMRCAGWGLMQHETIAIHRDMPCSVVARARGTRAADATGAGPNHDARTHEVRRPDRAFRSAACGPVDSA